MYGNYEWNKYVAMYGPYMKAISWVVLALRQTIMTPPPPSPVGRTPRGRTNPRRIIASSRIRGCYRCRPRGHVIAACPYSLLCTADSLPDETYRMTSSMLATPSFCRPFPPSLIDNRALLRETRRCHREDRTDDTPSTDATAQLEVRIQRTIRRPTGTPVAPNIREPPLAPKTKSALP